MRDLRIIFKRHLQFDKQKLLFLLTAIAAWFALLALHGLLPHMDNAHSTYISSIGSIQCGAEHPLELLQAKCSLMGGPAGSPIPQGLPFYAPAAFLVRGFSVSVVVAYLLVGAGVMALALYGAYKLFAAATQYRFIALFGSLIYLLSPLVFNMRGFGGTYWAILITPFMIYASWKLLNVQVPLNGGAYYRNMIALLAAWSAWSTTLLFLDGYGFVMCVISAYILLAAMFIKEKDKRLNTVVQACLILVGLMVAYNLYTKLLPTGSFGKSSLAIFRAMGLDISTLFIPTQGTWLANLLHMGANWSNLWGDSTNTHNYIGIFLLLTFIVGVVFTLKNRKISSFYLAMLLIGTFGLIFSLGPAIKINSQIPNNSAVKPYDMPREAAIPDLPVAAIDRYVPGFSTMRATYRWFILGEICIVFYAVVGLDLLAKRKNTQILIAGTVLILIDVMPSPQPAIAANTAQFRQNVAFNKEVIEPLKSRVIPGEKVLFYPDARGNNDYLANYMVPQLNINSYNVGDDKAVNNARKQWPGPILDLLIHPDLPTNEKIRLIRMAFDQNDVSLLVVPKFDLRWDSYAWPPKQQYPDRIILVNGLRESGEFTIQEQGRFFTVRQIKH